MAQISKGKTFVTGEQVTASNLNKIVDDATLQPGAITAQAPVTTVATTNLILTTPSTGSALNRVSLADVATSLNLAKTNVAQSFTGNLTMSGGADIILTNGSTVTLPSGASQTFASGASQTFASGASQTFAAGATLTLGQDPTADLQAATKKYVDNNFIQSSGGVVSIDPLAFSGKVYFYNNVTLSDTAIDAGKRLFLSQEVPASDNEAVCKSYVVSTINSKKIADIRFKSTATPGATTTVDYAATIPATVTRTQGNNIATLVFSSTTYFNVANPFFIPGQYIGLQAASTGVDVEPKLYKILTVTAASKTITIQTDATTAVANTQNLSIVYINTTPPALPSMLDAKGNKNIKSVYVCLASNKNYINYWYDSETGDTYTPPATSTTIPSLRTTLVSGQVISRSVGDNVPYFYSVAKMVEIQLAEGNAQSQPYTINNPTGFDVTSKGAHVGYFWDLNSSQNIPYVWDAHVVISK